MQLTLAFVSIELRLAHPIPLQPINPTLTVSLADRLVKADARDEPGIEVRAMPAAIPVASRKNFLLPLFMLNDCRIKNNEMTGISYAVFRVNQV
jgi:hypothetical protein